MSSKLKKTPWSGLPKLCAVAGRAMVVGVYKLPRQLLLELNISSVTAISGSAKESAMAQV